MVERCKRITFRGVALSFAILAWAMSCAADGPHWGDFKKDNCTKSGYRQYSAILWGIPFGASWEKACANQSATINGQSFAHPDRCVNTGTNMCGQFDVPDNSCKAQWGSFQRGACTAIGKRKYSAQILNVPPGQTWENACATTPANVQGQSFATPSRCNKTLVAGEWGEFDVHDNTCQAHWDSFQRGECTANGKREYSAQLTVPDGLSWESTCATTPATVAGQSFRFPTRCEKRLAGVAGEWGIFDVNDAACEVHLLPNQWPNPNANPNAPIWGFADTHNHQFANLGFGGWFIAGQVFDPSPDGIKKALPWCTPFHGPGGTGDVLGEAVTQFSGVKSGIGHLVGGYPQFDGWPRWNTLDHQLAYYQWLKRAHAGGLQLMVMMAVNNEMLCEPMAKTGHAPLGCNDMQAVDRQLAKAKELESYIARNDGGWYKIVYSGAQARQAIHKGQLAVVLGIEVADLFNCGRVPNPCTNDAQGRQYVRTQLRKYYDLGVRHLFPIHATDNAFGGTAIFEDVYLLNNMIFGRGGFAVYDCSAQGVNFTLGIPSLVEQPLFQMLHGLAPGQVPSYPSKGQCNAQGLSDLGKFLVQEMMSLHMILDVDHMSWKGVDDALKIAEAPHYPGVISGHSGYIETSTGSKRHESQKNDQQLHRIANLGGMSGAITAQGVTKDANKDGIAAWGNTVRNDCSNSSKTFAQAYLYAVHAMGGAQKAHVALATDLMGGIYQPGPRFGDDACYSQGNDDVRKSERAAQNATRRVQYPFTLPNMTVPLYQSRACDGRDFSAATADCKRTFDFNVDGLANVGMLPDLIQDLRQIGVSDNDLTPLFRSAEGYISMWEKAERAKP